MNIFTELKIIRFRIIHILFTWSDAPKELRENMRKEAKKAFK